MHNARWTGFQNWWRGFLGVRQEGAPEASSPSASLVLPKVPRAGKGNVEVMVNDFLTAWLIEGDIVAAMGYVSERSYACLARESNEPSTFDYGLAPFQLMIALKSAHDSLAPRTSLDGLVVGTPVANPGLRLVNQPHQARFVMYTVTDEVATSFDCESQLTLAAQARSGPFSGRISPRRSTSTADATRRSLCCGRVRMGTGRSCPGKSERTMRGRSRQRRRRIPRLSASMRIRHSFKRREDFSRAG